jgi:Stage II sporulation protein E (SpoIIE)
MKSYIFFLLFLLNAIYSIGQSNAFLAHEKACEKMQEMADLSLSKGNVAQAKIIAIEALDEARSSGDANLITQSYLLLFRISNEQDDFYKSLDAGLSAFSESELALENYRLASILSLLGLFDKWKIEHMGLDYALAGLKLKNLDEKNRLYLLRVKAEALSSVGNTADAIKAWTDYREGAKTNSLSNEEMYALEQIALIYKKNGDSDKAIACFKEQNLLATWRANRLKQSTSANNIALCMQEKGDLQSALYYYDEALQNCPENASEYTDMCFNRAYLEKELGNGDFLKRFVDLGYKRALQNSYLRGVAKAQVIRGAIWVEDGNNNNARSEIMSAIELCEANKIVDIHIDALDLLMRMYGDANDREKEAYYDSQKQELIRAQNEKSKQDAKMNSNFALAVEQTKTSVLAVISKSKEMRLEMDKQKLDRDNKEKTIALMQSEKELAKSEYERTRVAKEKALRELMLAQSSLENQQKENSIMELETARAAQLLELTKLEMDKQNETSKLQLTQQQNKVLESEAFASNEKIKREQNAKRLGFAIGALCILMAVSAFIVLAKVRKNKKVIESQNKELNHKNDDIEKSILSASYFQGSITPSSKNLKTEVKDGFILYKPLDTVSGDLPYVTSMDGYTYIAAIDCIGHGIPAAMLSFTAYYNLNKILDNAAQISLGEILEKLDGQIKSSLRSKGEITNFNAGMDVSLVRIDHKARVIEYAGAQSPLIVVNDSKCEYIKGSRFSVADINSGLNPKYESHSIAIEANAKYYLMSDGFTHQMRGDDNMKLFSRKRFLELLQSTYRLTFSEIEKTLNDAHLEWKGNNTQTDDILVIGFEI